MKSCISHLIGILFVATITFSSLIQLTQARTWLVGPDFPLKMPSEAIRQAKDGDIIKIMAGEYQDDTAIIRQNILTIEGIGGFAHLIAPRKIPNGKAIWVTKGKNITLQNIEFSGAHVPDKNGAGIRLESGSLTLDNCYFHHNEMGLLTANKADIRLTIRNSEFSHNSQDYKVTGKLSHNIYVGQIAEFTLENSISRGAKYGHNVKSRAGKNIIIQNRIFDEGKISASYLIDLPNGGEALIENNYLYKNSGAQNNVFISYGAEGMKYDQNKLTLKYNIAINEGGIAFLIRNHSDIAPEFARNKLTNITAIETSGIKKGGFWDGIKNKIRKNLD